APSRGARYREAGATHVPDEIGRAEHRRVFLRPPRVQAGLEVPATMIRLPAFTYLAPRTVDGAAQLLAEHGRDAMLVAGGSDLHPKMKRRQVEPKGVRGPRGVPPLRGIPRAGGRRVTARGGAA